jgi:hypothetical protein
MHQAVKHHWYGDRSPWSEQRSEDSYGFKEPSWPPTASKTVVLDGENPPQIRPSRVIGD